jgi:hypothetical protein
MNDQEFDALCNELAGLAEETARLPLQETAKKVLDDVRSNALAQHFQMVLVSPFQGGKSTIFNTLCGGRELSPTGFGLKTSAAIAEARYLEEESEEEHAVVEWRSDGELLENMELVLPQLAHIEPRRFGGKGSAEESALRLESPRDRLLLQKAVKLCREDPGIANRPEKTDLLDVAWLMAEHYPYAVRALRTESRVLLAQATQWLTFPLDWIHRRLEDFRAEEVVFLFLKRVVFYLREPALRTLRASIIDAPGLQASRWDTHVATESIRRAHAVIFLLGTQGKAMTLSDLEEIGRFNEFGLSQNVFYGYNARGTQRKGCGPTRRSPPSPERRVSSTARERFPRTGGTISRTPAFSSRTSSISLSGTSRGSASGS